MFIVDDLRWADELAGRADVRAGRITGRRLGVAATVEPDEEGAPLQQWLADVRRFPGVAELSLGRLDRVTTAEQLAGLLGRPPHQALVDTVSPAAGRRLLTTLLVRGVSPDARSLPAGCRLNSGSSTRAWRRLSSLSQGLDPARRCRGNDLSGQIGSSEVARRDRSPDDMVPLMRRPSTPQSLR